MRPKTKLFLLFITLPLVFMVSIMMGRYPLNIPPSDDVAHFVLMNIRIPRVLLAVIAGSCLSVAGAILQSVLRNPLASPYILGVTQATAFGAALAMYLMLPSALIIFSSFIFGLIATLLVLLLSRVRGFLSPVTVILSGIVVGAIFTTMLSAVQYMIDPWRLQGIVFWLMGSFGRASWDILAWTMPISLIALSSAHAMRWRLNILSLGDEEARMLGARVQMERALLIALSALMCATVTSVSGIVAFIGLIAPHMARALVGPDARLLVPASAALGGVIMMIADDVCRTPFSFEIPLSIVTTLVAAPYFIYLLRRMGGEWRG
ncbi:MAG: iron ABC transporter permease [Thermoprotei archaeon]|nr:MAG: iron ABC transporter permease [Thermoprotei archaeon]RLF22567.1 MAG: iron ABC transporter permease [Thermoprotei archaeon]